MPNFSFLACLEVAEKFGGGVGLGGGGLGGVGLGWVGWGGVGGGGARGYYV